MSKPLVLQLSSKPFYWWGSLRLRNPCLIVRLAESKADPTVREPEVWPPDADDICTPWRLKKSISVMLAEQRKHAKDWSKWAVPEKRVNDILEPKIVEQLAMPRWLIGSIKGHNTSIFLLDTICHMLWEVECHTAGTPPIPPRWLYWVMHPKFGLQMPTTEATRDAKTFLAKWSAAMSEEGPKWWHEYSKFTNS